MSFVNSEKDEQRGCALDLTDACWNPLRLCDAFYSE